MKTHTTLDLDRTLLEEAAQALGTTRTCAMWSRGSGAPAWPGVTSRTWRPFCPRCVRPAFRSST
jgi:hypothetical protein